MQTKLWTKDFIINIFTNTLIYMVYYILIVVTASYAIDALHASTSQAGLATGLFILGGLLARLISGKLINRLGSRKILFTGLFIYLITSCLYFFIANISLLFIVRLLHGIGFGMSSQGTSTIAARLIPKDKQGEGISYFGLSMTLASALGPLTGMFLNQHSSFFVIIIVCVLLVVVDIFISLSLRNSKTIESLEKANAVKNTTRLSLNDFFEKKSLPISVICMLIVLAYSSILTYLAKFAQFTGENSIIAASSVFFLVYSLVILISRPIMGRVFDKKGANFLIYPSIVLFSIGFFLLGTAYKGNMVILSSIFVGLGYGTFFSCANSTAIKESSTERIHLATSTFFIFADLGAGIGPFVLGLLIPGIFTFRELYTFMAIYTLCLVFAYALAHGRNESAKKKKAKADKEAQLTKA